MANNKKTYSRNSKTLNMKDSTIKKKKNKS